MGSGIGRLAFGIGGAIIGSFFGAAGFGFVAGSLIGSFVFQEAGPTIESGKLDDLTISSSANGNPVRLGAGTVRLPAEVIDGTDIVEEKQTQEVGGKGMSSGGTQVTYRYYANLFLSFGEPLLRSIKGGSAATILKFFADGKLVFDDSPSGLDLTTQAFTQVTSKGSQTNAGFQYRFYPGTEAQLPDPFFEDLHGVGRVSAYRGQVCVALERWPLEDYGNRIPIMTAIVAFNALQSDEVRVETSFPDRTVTTNVLGINWDYARSYSRNSDDTISAVDTTTMTEVNRGPDVTAFGRPDGEGTVDTILVAPLSGRILISMGNVGPGFGLNAGAWGHLHSETLDCIGRLGKAGASVSLTPPTVADPYGNIGAFGIGAAVNDCVNVDATIFTFGCIANGETICIVRLYEPDGPPNPQTPEVGHIAWVWGGGASDGLGKVDFGGEAFFTAVAPGQIHIGSCEFLMATGYNASNPGKLYRVTVQSGAIYRIADASFAGVIVFPQTTDLGLTATTQYVSSIMFDRTDNTHILNFADTASTDDTRFMKVDVDGSVIWDTGWLVGYSPLATQLSPARVTINQSRLANDTICLRAYDGNLYDLNTVTGEVGEQHLEPVAYDPATTGAFDSVTKSMIGLGLFDPGTKQLFCGRFQGLGESLGNINRYLADRLGYDALSGTTEVDATELDAIIVEGYAVTREMEGVAAVRPLTQGYSYEVVESDHKIKMRLIEKASVATLTEDDIIPMESELRPIVTEERIEDLELPARVNVQYMDISLDYQPGLQREQRLFFPNPTMRSQNQVSIDLPIAFNAPAARDIAERLLYRAWVERTQIKFKTAWEYIHLEPCDVITLQVNNATFKVRILQMTYGADETIEFSGVTHAAPVYTPSGISADTDAGDGLPQVIDTGSVAFLKFLDNSPLLRNEDNSSTTIPEYYGCGVTPGFTPATIYRQELAGSWEAIDRCIRETVRGFAKTALAAPTYGAFYIDTVNSVTLSLVDGEDDSLVTQSDAQFRANGLVLLIGREVVGVKNVTDNGDGSYTFDTLMRGLLGTEQHVGSHAKNEAWFLLSNNHLMVLQEPASNLNVSSLWKAVADSQSFDLAPPTSHAPDGVTLKPYAPVNVQATTAGGGTITGTFSPRSRLISNMRDGIDAYIESEPTQEYEIDVLSNGSLVRTLASTTPGFVYSSAQQIADFGGLATDVTFNVYKLHSLYGRGYAGTLDYTGGGTPSVVAPSAVGTITKNVAYNPSPNYLTFNVTPAAGSGTTMLVVFIAYAADSAVGGDDIRFLEMQGDSFVKFADQDMVHVPWFSQVDSSLYTGMADIFYLLNPGTTVGAVEIAWPNGLQPKGHVVYAQTFQDVNPDNPISTVRGAYGNPVSALDAPPTWPNASSPDYTLGQRGTRKFDFYKETDSNTLGVIFQNQQDPRKLISLRVDPFTTALAFDTSTGTTTGNTAAPCGRLMTHPLTGPAGTLDRGYWNCETYETGQDRVCNDLVFEINGLN